MTEVVTPLIFGEILFDRFPDGNNMLGGAPFNVAWHLQAFSQSPLLLSRLGDDALADIAHDKISAWGMSDIGIQKDPQHPTGQVDIKLDDGQAIYTILPDQAYDFIDSQIIDVIKDQKIGMIYHGSLAIRSQVSLQSLQQLLATVDAPVFVDVNLRQSWWQKSAIIDMMQRADIVKINDEELQTILDVNINSEADLYYYAQGLADKYTIQRLIVTRGSQGVIFFSQGRVISGLPAKLENITDTVGAGDAFSAVTIFGLLQSWDDDVIVERALEFASVVCQTRGAVIMDRKIYDDFVLKWS